MDDAGSWNQLEPWAAEQAIRFLLAQADEVMAGWRQRRGKGKDRAAEGNRTERKPEPELEEALASTVASVRDRIGTVDVLASAEDLRTLLEVALGRPVIVERMGTVTIREELKLDLSAETVRGILKGVKLGGGASERKTDVHLRVGDIEASGEVVGIEIENC